MAEHRPIGDILAAYDTWRAERDQAHTQEAWHASDVAGIDLLHELVGATTTHRVAAAAMPIPIAGSEADPVLYVVAAGADEMWWAPLDDQPLVAAVYSKAATMVEAGTQVRIEQLVVSAEGFDLESLTEWMAGGTDDRVATVREVQAR